METTMQRMPWWSFAVGGVALLIFGILAVAWPGITIAVLAMMFGAVALVDGIFTVLGGVFTRGALRWFLLLAGVISAVIGVAILSWPGITALVVLYIIGAWAVIAGVMRILAAMLWPQERRDDRWLLVLGGIIAVTLGVLILAWPVAGALAIIWLIALFAILFGIMLIGIGLSVRKSSK